MTPLQFPMSSCRAQNSPCGLALPIFLLFVCASAPLMTGCAGMVNDGNMASQTGTALQGTIHGGQQPVTGATVQLYAAQAGGYSGASVPLISSTVTTSDGSGTVNSNANAGNANNTLPAGSFTITGDYSCPASPNDQVYLVASGGNPGGGVNANLVLMAALGPCSGLSPTMFVSANELTTVAAAYALSGFAADYQHIGTTSTNYVGLQNAFATVNNLVNIGTGVALAVTPAYATQATGTTTATFKSTVPQTEINSLGNILASCVNTDGIGGSSANCASLFTAATPPGGTAPTDTFQAALNIAQNPGVSVGTLYTLSPPSPPFAPVLPAVPNDWTIALNFIGGGLGGVAASSFAVASDLAIDAVGNVWVVDNRSVRVTELNNLGAPVSPSTTLSGTTLIAHGGYSGGGLSSPGRLAIDLSGDAWITNGNGTLSEFASNGSATSGVSGISTGLSAAVGLAIDGSNNVWAVCNCNIVAELSNSGTVLSGAGYTSGLDGPNGAMAFDGGGNLWVVNSFNSSLVKLSGGNGSLLANSGTGQFSSIGPFLAIDGSGQAWVPEGSPVHAIELFAANDSLSSSFGNGNPQSIGNPIGVAIDGAGNVWSANAGNNTCGPLCTVVPNITELSSTGSTISSNTGYTGTGTGLLSSAKSIGLDSSGNVWVLNTTPASTVTEFVGVAAPSITPLALAVKNNAIGTRP